ncbi:hypothetical protein H8A97_35370 [Bradyrhizobium sp. Arg62]|uniref:hypothetical protein n=1 Tax=Bradyrhizobium brasilense TaxID=1419277 RepID=UPI001E6227BB|nr:hypothetical protein [Bradyrhizobium brasilense]MCC8950219.1 hypothetical protein [Bradyrhizobium brasilense]
MIEDKSATQVGTDLAQYHRERSDEKRKAVLATLRQIEAEIVEHGYFCAPENPDKHLRLSMSDVQRRAGVSEAYLRNPRHHDLREVVQDWLRVQAQKFATSKPEGKKVKRGTILFYERALQEVSAEALRWRTEKAAFEKQIADLKKEIAAMRRSDNVVGIKLRSK